MNLIIGAILVFAPFLSIVASEGQNKPATPAERYRALLKEYSAASGDFRKATTDLDRKAAVERLDKFSQRFLELADKNSKDPIALQALRQAVQAVVSVDSLAQQAWDRNQTDFPPGSKDNSAARAVTLLLRDHLKSAELGPVCEHMRYSVRTEYTEFLRSVLRTNPHRKVQAVACLALAQFLNGRLHMRDLVVGDRPKLTKCYEVLFGRDYLEELLRPSRATLAKKVETLFEQAAQYGDVKIRVGGTVGEQAKRELYVLRHLAVGKAAPEIEGRDQEGKRFKLSDYRGKIVLLYFWMEL